VAVPLAVITPAASTAAIKVFFPRFMVRPVCKKSWITPYRYQVVIKVPVGECSGWPSEDR
jgi:hypothetical protein